MMYVPYVRTCASITLRNVAVTSRRNVANQRFLRGRRVEPGNVPYSAKFSRRITFAFFADWQRTSKIKLREILEYRILMLT